MPLFLFALLLAAGVTADSGLHHHSFAAGGSNEYLQVTRPLPTDSLPPACSAAVFSHSFANTSGLPAAMAVLSPPRECPDLWSAVVLELYSTCDGPQRSRIAAVWLDGVELLRTSTTAALAGKDGAFWVVRKDVTTYSAVLRRHNGTISVMLENSVDEVHTGVYHLNISMLYYYVASNNISIDIDTKIRVYGGLAKFGKLSLNSRNEDEDKNGEEVDLMNLLKKSGTRSAKELEVDELVGNAMYGNQARMSLSNKPADLIIPISSKESNGCWYKIINSSDVLSKSVVIPPNTYQAMLEIFVSFHSDDELWYADPPSSFAGGHGKGAFRRISAAIDGMYVGSVVPFPVVYGEQINPLFWQPIVGIGAFDLPSYKLELSPFLGILLDEKLHTVSIRVEDATRFWLVDANLHLWLDHHSIQTHAKLVQYIAPALQLSRKNKVKKLINGKFITNCKHRSQFSGWVNSSFWNLTTHVINDLNFKNRVEIKGHHNEKQVEQSVSLSTEVILEANSAPLSVKLKQETKYYFELESSTQLRSDLTHRVNTELSNEIKDQSTLTLPGGIFTNSLRNEQEAEGWMVVKDNSVVDGSTITEQIYSFTDNSRRYNRKVTAKGGVLLSDNVADVCRTCLASYDENAFVQIY